MKQSERKLFAESELGVQIMARVFPTYVRVDLTFPDGKTETFFEGLSVRYLTRHNLSYWNSVEFPSDFKADFGYWLAWKFFPRLLKRNHFPEYYPDFETAYFDLVVMSALQTWIGRDGCPFHVGVLTTFGTRSAVDLVRNDDGSRWSDQDRRIAERVADELYKGKRPDRVSTINYIPFSIVV